MLTTTTMTTSVVTQPVQVGFILRFLRKYTANYYAKRKKHFTKMYRTELVLASRLDASDNLKKLTRLLRYIFRRQRQ